MNRILPAVQTLVAARPEDTIFTRFIPVRQVQDARGAWRAFYERWQSITLDHMDESLVELKSFVPPATVVDKKVYSPWFEPVLQKTLTTRNIDTVVISGGETDVCVLATVLGAIDCGYHVIIAKDALCSSCDETHDALIALYETRFHEQIDALPAAEIVAVWKARDL